MTTETRKENTLRLRMDNVTLNMLERASGYLKLNKSKFIRQSIREKAEVIISEHEKTRFTQDDWVLFFDLLDKVPEPTKRMKKSQKKYQEIIGLDEI